MKYSRSLKSSAHSLPSPDGAYIAAILPSKLTIRATRSLEILRVIILPPEFTLSIQSFAWSPSSKKILLAAGDTIRVFSIANAQFSASIVNPTSGTAKVTAVGFGVTDDELCVFSDFGLKLSIFKLSTSTSVEITSPKLYHVGNWSKGFAYRPRTQNLALLTRRDGKDVISLHTIGTYEVFRSWHPDTVDAQSLSWSPDGRWLAVVESAAQGHRILFYTADGHLYKTWKGPIATADDKEIAMGAGVRMLEWNATGEVLAIADYSSKVTTLSTPWFSESMKFSHTTLIKPIAGLHVWQETIAPSPAGGFTRTYNTVTNPISPPTIAPPSTSSTESSPPNITKSGTSLLSFDTSGTLLATRSDSTPTCLWIWSLPTRSLHTVILQHSPIAKATWHPEIPELLLIRCEGDESRGLIHFWEPTWEKPRIVDFGTRVPEGKIMGRSVGRWLPFDAKTPAVFFSDAQDCILAVVEEAEAESAVVAGGEVGSPQVPWQEAVALGVDIYGRQEESPLMLVAADEKRGVRRGTMTKLLNEPTMTGLSDMSGGSDDVDDTFRFRKGVI